jgi:tight adherence protein B
MIPAITVMVFIGVLCMIEGILAGKKSSNDRRRATEKLKLLSEEPPSDERRPDIVRRRLMSALPWLNDLLFRITLMQRFDNMLQQSNVHQSAGVVALLSIALAAAGDAFAGLATGSGLAGIFIAGILGSIPFLYIHFKRKRRMQKFERQMPDALELIARCLRAGHAFATGLHMVVLEFDDPVGTEFQKTERQIRLGASVEQAFAALADRIDCPDMRFFTVAVTIQRETGGNLAEILESISALIRGRFKLKGKVRALSAEGRFSALALAVLPFGIALVLFLVNPQYLEVLANDPLGKMLVFGSLFMMAIGLIVIKKMIDVKV